MAWSGLIGQIQFHGTMVRPHYIASDIGIGQTRKQPRTDQEVVYTPAHILLAGPCTIAPPCVGILKIRMDSTEGVDKAAVEQF